MIFLNSASSAVAMVFYLLGVCTHTDTEGKLRKARVRNILKSSKKTQYLMNTLYVYYCAPPPPPLHQPIIHFHTSLDYPA